jgi:hypothetical protein
VTEKITIRSNRRTAHVRVLAKTIGRSATIPMSPMRQSGCREHDLHAPEGRAVSDPRSPGQICYEGFWRATGPDFRNEWPLLPSSTQARWEAAAQAAITAWIASPDWPTPAPIQEDAP